MPQDLNQKQIPAQTPERKIRLSPSGATRWLQCPGSVHAEAQYLQSPSSLAADQGTQCHALSEEILIKHFGIDQKPSELLSHIRVNIEMMDAADAYTDFCIKLYNTYKEIDDTTSLIVEKRLDVSSKIPKCFGRADTLITGKDFIHIVDLKYGRHKVQTEGNDQLRIYAVGALLENTKASVIRITVFQPRINNVSTAEYSRQELEDWVKVIQPIAQAAVDGSDIFVGGEWCFFCLHKENCNRAVK